MKKQQMIEKVASDTGVSTSQAGEVVNSFLDAIADAVAGGETVTLQGFGTFERRERSARQGRNPQTGQTMEIAASLAPAFKASQAFRRRVNGEA